MFLLNTLNCGGSLFQLLVEDVVVDSCLIVALSLSSSEWAPKASIADAMVVTPISDVGGILYVVMLANEGGMRPDVVVSALVAPKPLVVPHVVVVGGDANCMEVVLAVDFVVDEGVVVGNGRRGEVTEIKGFNPNYS